MSRSSQFRSKAAECSEQGRKTGVPAEIRALETLERSFTSLADNEDWMERNRTTVVGVEEQHGCYGELLAHKLKHCETAVLAEDEDRFLRCLGTALVRHWDSLPAILQRELLHDASQMSDVPDMQALKAGIVPDLPSEGRLHGSAPRSTRAVSAGRHVRDSETVEPI